MAIRRAALVLLLVTGLSACSWLRPAGPEEKANRLEDRLRSEIAELVPDEDRRDAMSRQLDVIRALFEESAGLVDDLRDRERALFLDYDSTREDYLAVFAESRDARRQLQQRLIGAHLELRRTATHAEWEGLSKRLAQLTAARVEAIAQRLIAGAP